MEKNIQAEAVAESVGKVEFDLASAEAQHKSDREKSTLFCMGCSNILGEPIHKSLKRLCGKHGLTWLRILMSYRKFSNLGEKLHNDLSSKVMKGIIDKEQRAEPILQLSQEA